MSPAALKARALPALGLLALATLASAPGLGSDFVLFDDPLYVVSNARIHAPGWAGFSNLWDSSDAWAGRFLEFFPLRDSLYWVLFQAFGARAWPFHLASLLLHLGTTLLVWALARRLLERPAVAWVAGALFAVHPIHTESVTWVAGLKDPLHVGLMLGALLCFQAHRLRGGGWRYGAGLGLLVLALWSKSMAVVTPLLLLLLERFDGPTPPPWRATLLRVAAPALISAGFLWQFVGIARVSNVVMGPHGGDWRSHLTLALWAQARYAQQALLPLDARFIYCFEPPSGWADPRLWLGLAVLGGAGALFLKGGRLLRLLVGWHFACLLPVANLVPFPAVLADRYLYASSVAACVGLAWLVARAGPRLFPWLSGALLLGWLSVAALQAARWNDEEALYAEADEDPACLTDSSNYAAKAHFQRAVKAKEPAVAFAAFQRALDSRGFARLSPPQVCSVLLQATIRAVSAPATPGAATWGGVLTERCPELPAAWFVAGMAALTVDPPLAHARATRAVALNPTGDALMLLALSERALGRPPEASLERAFVVDAPAACGVLRSWAARVAPEAKTDTAPWLARCAAAKRQGQ